MQELKSLRLERNGHVAELVLLGPGKGNALGVEFWVEMPQALEVLAADEEVRVVLLRGQGANFTYGLDLVSMMSSLGPLITGDNQARERTRLHALIAKMQLATEGLAQLKKPVVAAVQGWCIGGGLDVVAACDVRYASADARFSLREAKVGIVADMGSLQRLPRIIGEGNTRELAYRAHDIDAQRALAMHLVSEVFATPEALLEGARARCQEMANNPPLVVQGCKQIIEYCADKSIADGLRYVALWNSAFLQSHDLNEAFAAFAEKRPPKFEGR